MRKTAKTTKTPKNQRILVMHPNYNGVQMYYMTTQKDLDERIQMFVQKFIQ